MAVAANKRSVMTLYSCPNNVQCHQVRIVLAEKGVSVDIVYNSVDVPPTELIQYNPVGNVPTLIDRDLMLNVPRIIMEYLDERFPHPPLIPVYPVARSHCRMLIEEIEKNMHPLLTCITQSNGEEKNDYRKQFLIELLKWLPIFEKNRYIMGEEFSLVDCFLSSILWRLPIVNIDIEQPMFKQLKQYMIRIFERDAFLLSLTEAERNLRTIKKD